MKKIISLSRGRTLSGHTWFTARKFLILNLSSLHPSGKPYLGKPVLGRTVKLVGYGPQLLDDSLGWSDYESDYSALFKPARISLRRRCTADTRRSGTSYGGMTPDTHGRLHGLHTQGWPAHKMKPCGARRCLAPPARYREDILKILRDLLGYVRSHDSCNLLLLSGYLLDLTYL